MGVIKNIMVLFCLCVTWKGGNKCRMFRLFNKSLVCMKHVLAKPHNRHIRDLQRKKNMIDSGY